MYPKFIELHMNDAGSGIACTFNVDHITDFWEDESGMTRLYCIGFEDAVWIQESYEEVKKLIHDAGVFVQQTDPRLDVTHPLTMEELKDMIGEPAWNSNAREWGLIVLNPTHNGKEHSGFYLRYADLSLTRYDEEDLKKFPLYRIRPKE